MIRQLYERLNDKIDDALYNYPDDDRLIDWKLKVFQNKETHVEPPKQPFFDLDHVQFDFNTPLPSLDIPILTPVMGQAAEEEAPIEEDNDETDTDIEAEKPDGKCFGGGVNNDKDDEGGDGGGNGIGGSDKNGDAGAGNDDVNGKGGEDSDKVDGGEDVQKGDGVNEEDLKSLNDVVCNAVGSVLGSQGPIHLTQMWTDNAGDVGSIFGSSVVGKD